jgi:hypothetical protein
MKRAHPSPNEGWARLHLAEVAAMHGWHTRATEANATALAHLQRTPAIQGRERAAGSG